MIDAEFLNLLACPLCLAPLKQEGEKLLCTEGQCNLRYAIRDEIPIMLIDEAERPCPSCSAPRVFEPDKDQVRCEKCGATFQKRR